MRGYKDLDPGGRIRSVPWPPRPENGLDRSEVKNQSMFTLCPGAFDGFTAYDPLPEPPRTLKVLDPGGRLDGATRIDEATAKLKSGRRPQRVLSVVISGGGAGAEAYGSGPVKVVVPGYRPDAEAYYLSGA